MRLKFKFFLVLLALSVGGCRKSASPAPEQLFVVKGVVQRVDADKKIVIIKHEEIPDFMPAMTMPLDVRNASDLKGLMGGTVIRFKMHYTTNEMWIDQIEILGQEPAPVAQKGPQVLRKIRDVETLSIGDALLNYKFTNQLGQLFETKDLKGSAFGLTFIFTRCPNPKFCPLMSSRFAQAQTQLMSSDIKNWKLISLTIDPENDTPAKMKAYAGSYQADPDRWIFATGDMEEINAIGDHFSLTFYWPQGGMLDHNLRTVIINAEGKVHKIYEGDAWTVDEFVQEMGKAARNQAPVGR